MDEFANSDPRPMSIPRFLTTLAFAVPLLAGGDAIPLDGQWRFRIDRQDRGVAERWFASRLPDRLRLPGSLQEQGFGNEVTEETKWVARWGVDRKDYPDWRTHPMFEKYRQADHLRFPYWLQPKKHYLGLAWYQRDLVVPAGWKGKRITLYLERCHWKTTVWVDGRPYGENDSLGTPHVYELAGLGDGQHTVSIAVDNRMIYPLGVNAHSVGDQTQTTWNGIVGRIELRASEPVWIDEVQVFPDPGAGRIRVRAGIGNITGKAHSGSLAIAARANNSARRHEEAAIRKTVETGSGRLTEVDLDYPLGTRAQRWDEFDPALYRARLTLEVGGWRSEAEVSLGMREIRANGASLILNGRTLFLRGTLECAIFPLTGYPPTDPAAWKRIMRTAKAHGLNHLRFHSWFPPEAAFVAADEEGVYLHPEAHLWGPVTEKNAKLRAYLLRESRRLLSRYGNHPSFVMFGLGNESFVEKPIMSELLAEWKRDPRRVYTGPANANGTMIPEYDYYIGRAIGDHRVRYQSGWPPVPENVWFLDRPPQTRLDFREAVALYGKPLIAHETVQRCSYPDLGQAAKYTGSLRAAYLDIARDQLAERGMLGQARDFVTASGKWQVQQFKEEIEASLRTPGLAGFQLLDLHDFPGQGAALVGVLDAFWDSKGYVTPGEFTRFNSPTVPLARMEKRTWTTGETLAATLELAHFGAAPLDAVRAEWSVVDRAGKRVHGGRLEPVAIPTGGLSALGRVTLNLSALPAPARYRLVVNAAGHENDWDFWVYPQQPLSAPTRVIRARQWDDALARQLASGATVLLTPPKANIRGRLQQSFTSIYWNAPWTDGGESETMGILTDPGHPVFRAFPTEFHSNWQWFELLAETRSLTLDGWGVENAWPKSCRPLIQLIDDWNQNRKLAALAEARVGDGRLMLCAMDIETDLDRRVVARQFRKSLLDYLASPDFQPACRLTVAQARGVLQ
jgi:hypothetical protein